MKTNTKTIYVSDDGKEYETEEEAKKADEAYALTSKEAEKGQSDRQKAAIAVKDAREAVTQEEKRYSEALKKLNSEYKKALKELNSKYSDDLADIKKPLVEARKCANAELADFCSKYGAYHESVSLKDIRSLNDWIWGDVADLFDFWNF